MIRSSEGRVAVVTGAGKRRVGHAVAAALAQRGYAIAMHYHRSRQEALQSVEEFRRLGVRAEAFQADLTIEAEVDRFLGAVALSFGRIDVLVTAAGLWQAGRLEEVTADEVRSQFDVNALASFLCARRAGLMMVAQPEGGAIVTLGDWAIARPYPGYAGYFPSKGAVVAMTRSLAVELAMRNPAVRVNCILPGPVMLPEDLPQQEREEAIRGTLVRREGRPEHVAHAVLFLVENDFVTGVCLPVDGGRTLA